jgi:ATP-dependent Lon protease, bacterial type
MVKVTKDHLIIPLRDVVVFPGIVTTLFVGRSKSIEALNSAMASDKKLVLVAQKDASNEDPTFKDIYHFGTVSNLLQLIKLPDGTMKVLVEGAKRCKIDKISESKGLTKAAVTEIDDDIIKVSDSMNLVRFIKTKFNDYVSSTKKIPPEILSTIDAIDDLSKLIDNIVNHLNIDTSQKQEILEIFDLQKRSESILTFIESQLDVIDVEKRIRSRVKKQMEKSQREYYLNEKIKAAQKELGEMGEEGDDFEVLKNKIEDSGMSKEAMKKSQERVLKILNDVSNFCRGFSSSLIP